MTNRDVFDRCRVDAATCLVATRGEVPVSRKMPGCCELSMLARVACLSRTRADSRKSKFPYAGDRTGWMSGTNDEAQAGNSWPDRREIIIKSLFEQA